MEQRSAIASAGDRVKRILSYYLDCIREDEGPAARLFLNAEGRTYLSLPLRTEWNLADTNALNVTLGSNRSFFTRDIRQRGAAAALYYGYPLYVDWIARSRRGRSLGFAIPVFMQNVEFNLSGSELRLHLLPDWPRVNPEFLGSVFRTPEERRGFLHDLGLLDTDGDPPAEGLAFFTRRLAELGVPAPTIEPLNPEDLQTQPPTSALSQGGMFNRAVLVVGERPRFTQGLDRELGDLIALAPKESLGTSAMSMVMGAEDSGEAEETQAVPPIVEVVPLNDEQRAAVRSAFRNPMTVVTGPPGTGKSQVVTTVLANAYLRGERVLFTSRNNKAVDVVETRLNGLSSTPLLVRAGSQNRDRNFRAELIQFLSQVLSGSPSEDDRRAERDAQASFIDLENRRDHLWQRLEEVRNARNLVDRLDLSLAQLKESIPSEVWESLENAPSPPEAVDPQRTLQLIEYHSDDSISPIGRVRRWFRRRGDFAAIDRVSRSLRESSDIFGDLPEAPVSVGRLTAWRAALQDAMRRLQVVRQLAAYREELDSLGSWPSTADFADELAPLEEQLWECSANLIAARGRLLPDRLSGDLRRALSEFRATIERLSQDRLGGRVYAGLRRDMERLWSSVTDALPIWCVTNLSARGSLPLDEGLFDLAIIDEASQCDIPSALPVLHRARRVMVIGDPNQLRHISNLSPQRDQQLQLRHGLTSASDMPYTFDSNSLYDLASASVGDTGLITLREHFRSHADIITFSNERWYRYLQVCTDYRKLNVPSGVSPGIRWTSVKGETLRPGDTGAINPIEAGAVVEQLDDLLVNRLFRGSVGVVTPFRAQVNRIRDLVNERLDLAIIERSGLIVDTAHGFQGDERDIILFSPCVSQEMPRGAQWFLETTGNLFNVAITRARTLLHVVGDSDACGSCGVPHIEAFAKYVAGLSDVDNRDVSDGAKFHPPTEGPWEDRFRAALEARGLAPIPQHRVNQYWLDLAIVKGDVLIDIEIDGELYHREWDRDRCRADVVRDIRLTALGWRVKRFWVYRIRDELDDCVEEVLKLSQASGL